MTRADRPIFVVGVGRSGTSLVARVLHTQMGVSMGSRFVEPNENNPKGYYEDLDFRDINQRVMTQTWGGLHWFVRSLETLLEARIAAGRPWGMKDPRLCYLLPYYLTFCPEAKVVLCTRDHNQVLNNLTTKFGCALETAEPELARREALVESLVADRATLTLDFTERRTDEEIAARLQSLLREPPAEDKRSLVIGRFQPLHEGHVALIRHILDEGRSVLVLLRPGGHDADNPYSSDARWRMFTQAFPDECADGRLRGQNLALDIAEICYGRKVGWGIREIRLDSEIEAVSGTAIRKEQCLSPSLG